MPPRPTNDVTKIRDIAALNLISTCRRDGPEAAKNVTTGLTSEATC